MRGLLLLCALLAAAAVAADASAFVGRASTKRRLTLSGVSAGGAMAMQYQFAHSSEVAAAGVIAGIPYMCAAGTVPTALACMSDPWLISVEGLLTLAAAAADLGNIDATSNLVDHSVTLWSGQDDTVVNQGTMKKLAEMYQKLGVWNLTTYFNSTSEHAWITDDWGNNCSHFGTPFVNKCAFDFAGNMLQQAWGRMGLPFNTTKGAQDLGALKLFDQAKYGAIESLNSIDTHGYVYVPSRCAFSISGGGVANATTMAGQATATASVPPHRSAGGDKCLVHVSFHGCEMGRKVIGDAFVAHAGLNEWAESNGIVVVYPQVVPRSVEPYNPKGCFDWWGYAGETYALKWGPQIAIVEAMVKASEAGHL